MSINPINLSHEERKFLIEESYSNARNQINPFLLCVRTDKNNMQGKYSVNLVDLRRLFNSNGWRQHKLRSGHVGFTHLITGVKVGFSNHGNNNVDPGVVDTVFEKLQRHVNILGNEIFEYKRKNWSFLPKIEDIERNWISYISKV